LEIIINNTYNVIILIASASISFLLIAIHDNAARTMIPELVQRNAINRTNGYFTSIGQISSFLAPLAAGWAVSKFGAGLTLIIAAISFLFAIILAYVVKMMAVNGNTDTIKKNNVLPRISIETFFRQRWLLIGLSTAVVTNFFLVPLNLYLAPIQIKEAGFGPMELGYYSAALSAGVALSGFVQWPLSHRISREMYSLLAIAAAAPVYILRYFFYALPAILVCGVLSGALLCVFEVKWHTSMQERSEGDMIGRIYSVGSWMSFAGRSAGVAVWGWVSGMLSVQIVIILCIIGIWISLVIILLMSKFISNKYA
jgi:MFS transporter, DHA3 family, macrolide efflux protein